MPLISIITTTYKHEKFITETIESILSQTFMDWELLIGDDNSPDSTYEIALKYAEKDSRIKVWKHPENLGIVGNMNFLLSQTSPGSKYIAFLEGDDIFTPDNLEKKLKIFEQFPKVTLVYNNLDFIDAEGKVFHMDFLAKTPFYLKNQKLAKQQFIEGGTFYGSYSTLMLKRDVLEKEKIINPTDDKLYSVSDWDLFFRVSTKYPIYGIEDSMTLYRKHGNNITSDNTKIARDLIVYMEDTMDIEKTNAYYYMLYHLKTYVNYLKSNRMKTVQYGLLTFRYSLTKDFKERIGMIVLSIMPQSINKLIYNTFKK